MFVCCFWFENYTFIWLKKNIYRPHNFQSYGFSFIYLFIYFIELIGSQFRVPVVVGVIVVVVDKDVDQSFYFIL